MGWAGRENGKGKGKGFKGYLGGRFGTKIYDCMGWLFVYHCLPTQARAQRYRMRYGQHTFSSCYFYYILTLLARLVYYWVLRLQLQLYLSILVSLHIKLATLPYIIVICNEFVTFSGFISSFISSPFGDNASYKLQTHHTQDLDSRWGDCCIPKTMENKTSHRPRQEAKHTQPIDETTQPQNRNPEQNSPP